MTVTDPPPADSGRTLAERLAPMSIAEIDAMSDDEITELMGASADEIAAEPVWAWREAAKAATDEYAERLAADARSGRAQVITDPDDIRRRLGGRPRVGGAGGRVSGGRRRLLTSRRERDQQLTRRGGA